MTWKSQRSWAERTDPESVYRARWQFTAVSMTLVMVVVAGIVFLWGTPSYGSASGILLYALVLIGVGATVTATAQLYRRWRAIVSGGMVKSGKGPARGN
jgi:membrane protein YdbS with pleckstrin-like domain